MSNSYLFANDKRGGKRSTATGSIALNGILRLGNASKHQFLERFVQRCCGERKKIGVELSHNMPTKSSHRSIASDFSIFMPTHPVCNNIKSERSTSCSCQCGRKHHQAVFIMLTLSSYRLSTCCDQLL